jgi:hypothetical protein
MPIKPKCLPKKSQSEPNRFFSVKNHLRASIFSGICKFQTQIARAMMPKLLPLQTPAHAQCVFDFDLMELQRLLEKLDDYYW